MATTKKKPLKGQSLPKSGKALSKEQKNKNLDLFIKNKQLHSLFPIIDSEMIKKLSEEDIELLLLKKVKFSKDCKLKVLKTKINKNVSLDLSYKEYESLIQDPKVNKKNLLDLNLYHLIKFINNNYDKAKRILTDSTLKYSGCYPRAIAYYSGISKEKELIFNNEFFLKLNFISDKAIKEYMKSYSFNLKNKHYIHFMKIINKASFNKLVKKKNPVAYLEVAASTDELEEFRYKRSKYKAILKNKNISNDLKDHIESVLAIRDILE